MALTLTITIHGKRTDDLVYALEELERLVEDGFTSGHNGNEDADFVFAIDGESEPDEESR